MGLQRYPIRRAQKAPICRQPERLPENRASRMQKGVYLFVSADGAGGFHVVNQHILIENEQDALGIDVCGCAQVDGQCQHGLEPAAQIFLRVIQKKWSVITHFHGI